jgi:acetate kinase
MAVEALILAANPGSASRKYAIFNKGGKLKASLHYEFEENKVICNLEIGTKSTKLSPDISKLDEAPAHIADLLKNQEIFKNSQLYCIGLRVVAPTSYFLKDIFLNDESLGKLQKLKASVPLHVQATLNEAQHLQKNYPGIPIVLVSDSACHINKPDFAWNYAIHLEDADKLEIKRFGYHGISISSITNRLYNENILLEKMIICHLGSGSSITALLNGQSQDNTMGYSPLEGMMMATRSGPLDVVAALTLKAHLGLNDEAFEDYLNKSSGLQGISGESSDIRELLKKEANGHYRAGLALRMFVYKAQQAIAQMVASIGGVDGLVFTGTVGARSAEIRSRIINGMEYLNLVLDQKLNEKIFEPIKTERISLRTRNKPIYVITTDEATEIAMATAEFMKTKT